MARKPIPGEHEVTTAQHRKLVKPVGLVKLASPPQRKRTLGYVLSVSNDPERPLVVVRHHDGSTAAYHAGDLRMVA
jgi:hypothetical protein